MVVFLFMGLLLNHLPIYGATVGDIITNKATASYSVNSAPKTIYSNEVNTTVSGTKPIIEFMQYSANSTTSTMIGGSRYLDGSGTWQTMPPPILPDGMTLSTTTPEPINIATQYRDNDIAIISLTDIDRNTNPNVREIVTVTITSPFGDIETIELIETSPNSGVFTGYIPLISQQSSPNNGKLYVRDGDTISVKYLDQSLVYESTSAIIASPVTKDLWVEKSVNKSVVGIGDSVLYTILVHNENSFAASNVKIADLMPVGLKYLDGTFKIDGALVTPIVSTNGLEISTTIPNIPSNGYAKITLQAQVGAVNTSKELINQTWATSSSGYVTNIATASLRLKEELFREHGIIIGQVYDSAFKSDKTNHGVGNVRIYLEDGTFVVTDEKGKYHFEGIKSGTHVVQVDEDMLPSGYTMGSCQENARVGNRNFSQFVDLSRGALKRVDFCLVKDVKSTIETNSTKAPTTVKKYEIPNSDIKMPIYSNSDLAGENSEILWPKIDYVPSIPSTSIAIKYPKNHKAEVWLNGSKVHMINFDGKTTGIDYNMVIDRYKGVDLLNNANKIEVKLIDEKGVNYKTLTREIFVSSKPVKVIYMPKLSNPISDGISPCVIAVKLLDSSNKPLRAGINGIFNVNAPFRSISSIDELKNNPLAVIQPENKYVVGADGVAYITLAPTTQTGELSLGFPLENKTETIKAWLKPGKRKWIMVGFAEGTVGYNKLKSNMDTNKNNNEVIKEGRVSFFAKGTIKADLLLSLAYDSGKDTKNMRYFGEIDPNSYYTIYNDNTIQGYEASSTKKLYVKLENDKFNLLFGDFNTDMVTTQLTQYSRTFTGLKGEYHDENINGKAFVSYTNQVFQRDEIRGDGTSGFYYTKSKPVIANSEKITLEVRDRYRNEIIISKDELVRYRDYEIDYSSGRIFFKEPIYSVDGNFNPRYIVINYEIKGDGGKHYTYGGRVATKTSDGDKEIGVSVVSEDTGTGKNEMIGVDSTIRLTPNTTLKAEYALSKNSSNGVVSKGDAKLVEIEHLSNGFYARGYYREQDDSFGLGQLSNSLGGTRKIGVEASKLFNNRLSLQTLVYRDMDLEDKSISDVAEIKASIIENSWSMFAGYRYAKATAIDATNLMLIGGSYALFDQRLKLSTSYEKAIGSNDNQMFPTKINVGASYALNSWVDIFANYEWANSSKGKYNIGRVGTRVRPWNGMSIEHTTMSEYENDIQRLYNTTGFLQSYQLTKRIWLNGGYEKGVLLDGNITKQSDEFDAYRAGVAYKDDSFTATLNGEYRDGTLEDKRNITAGVYTQPNDNVGVAFSSLYNYTKDTVGKSTNINTALSVVYRPTETKWIVLDKLEYEKEQQEGVVQSDTRSQKLINNIQANYTPNDNFELSLQHGAKYVFDDIDGYNARSFVNLVGFDARYDITQKIDIGVQSSMLFANSSQDIGIGAYVGYNIFDTAWLTVGYNHSGFSDNDFDLQTYRSDGVYLKLRMRFDQKSLGEMAKALAW